MNNKWANLGEDAGALHALLARIPEQIAVSLIDTLSIFPPRPIAIGESIVVVIGAFDEDTQRRRVLTAHFTVARSRRGEATVSARFDEHATAPVDAVPRIVQGVLRRLGEDAEALPREEQIGGEEESWQTLLLDLGATSPAPVAEAPLDDDPAAAADVTAGAADESTHGGVEDAETAALRPGDST